MDKLWYYLAVGLGSALGGMARVGLASLAARRWGDSFPWGTLLINVAGSFAIGLFAGGIAPGGRWTVDERTAVFFTAGICGGFTTFSAFSLQTLRLLHNGELWPALANVTASVALCLLAVWLGFCLGKTVSR